MHVGRFHGALESIKRGYKEGDILNQLSKLKTALQQSINQPNENTAKVFKDNYESVLDVLANCETNTSTPTRCMIYQEIGATKYLGESLSLRIQKMIRSNQVVPANVLVEINSLIQQTAQFINSINKIIAEFESLDIEYTDLGPGEFEGGISIPKLLSPNLEDLSKEFSHIDNFIKTIKEIVGDAESDVSVKHINSSEWQVFIELVPEAAACSALAIERIIALYKNHLEIKKLKIDMEEKKLPEAVTKPMQDYIDGVVQEKLREIGEQVVNEYYQAGDEGRKNELKTKLTMALKYVAQRIDHGATFQVEAALPDEPIAAKDQEGVPSGTLEKYEASKLLAEYVNEKNSEISQLHRSDEPTLMLKDESDKK